MQEASRENTASEVVAAEAAAADALAQQARGEESVSGKPTVDLAGEHPNADADTWESLTDEFDDVVVPPVEEVIEETLQKPKPVEDEIPAPEVVPDEVIPAVAEETPVEVPKDAVVTPPTEDVVIPTVPREEDKRSAEEVKTAMDKARGEARESLVNAFKLTETQVEEFREDPNSVLPQLAADLYLDIYNNVMQSVSQNIPGMVTGVFAQQNAQKAHEQAFYNAWPQLAKAEYMDTVNRIADNYHALNPNADAATAIQEIGAQTWVTLRLPMDKLMEHTQATNVPVVPAQTPTPSVSRIPANAGSVPNAAKAPASPALNSFEQLAEEFIDDDFD
jgi:hypothetical protein